MSQLIACKNRNGIVLAADGRAVDVDASGQVMELTVTRMFQLTGHCVLLAGGAAVGQHMARALQDFIRAETPAGAESVYAAALSFLASEYAEFMRKTCEIQPLDPIHQVHFILAGRSDSDVSDPFKLYFLWTRKKLPQLDGDEIASAFTVPRTIRLEHRLNQMAGANSALDRIEAAVREAMHGQAEQNQEVGGPFVYAKITQNGIDVDTD